MVSPIGNVVHNQLEAQPAAPAASRASSPAAASQPAATDTVRLSSAAKAVLQEATETPAQTAKEANAGDVQARRLLARLAHH